MTIDIYSGLSRCPEGFSIPDWEVGTKVSDSGSDGVDDSSSDASSGDTQERRRRMKRKEELSLQQPYPDSSDDEDGEDSHAADEDSGVALLEGESTPRGKDRDKDRKGKGRESVGSLSPRYKSGGAGSTSTAAIDTVPASARSTVKSRPRPRSNSKSSFSPGPAAQAFSSLTLSSPFASSSSSSVPAPSGLASSSSIRLNGAPLGRKPLGRSANGGNGLLSTRTGTLGRASSAPTNLFGGSPPVHHHHQRSPRLTSSRTQVSPAANATQPHQSQAAGTLLASGVTDTEVEDGFDSDASWGSGAEEELGCPSSPESSIEAVINQAYDRREGDIVLSSRSLTTLPDVLANLSHFVSLDLKTGKSFPTPIRLYLAQNYLTSASLTPALFSIKNLEHLSLRGNYIERLPTSISKLKSLRYLQLFNNKIEYLPAEILELSLTELQVGSNPLRKYSDAVAAPTEAVKEAEQQEGDTLTPSAVMRRHLAPRKHRFTVPSLVELCTRKLLEPVVAPVSSSKSRTFSPSGPSAPAVRRNFHLVKDSFISPRTDILPPPPHLLKPFLPLLHPLPHHLRALLSPVSVPRNARQRDALPPLPLAPAEISECTVCKMACVEFAERRLEWRAEIAGVRMCSEEDQEGWVPVLWRGCSKNCLDFLEEPLPAKVQMEVGARTP